MLDNPWKITWTAIRSNQSILRDINPEYSLEEWHWNSNILVIWCKLLIHWKSFWCWERLRAEGEEAVRGWNGWMTSPVKWAWTWANFGRWWGRGRPGVLQSVGSHRVRRKRVTEQQSSSSLLKKQCSLKNIIKCTRGKKESKSCNPSNNANSRHTLPYTFFPFWPRYAACGLPDQGSDQCSFQWKHRFLITGPPGKSPPPAFFF